MPESLTLLTVALAIGIAVGAAIYATHWSTQTVIKWLQLEMVDGISYWKRLYSVRFAGASAVLGVASQVLPLWFPDAPQNEMTIISTILAALAGVASLIKQPKLLADIQADKEAACPVESKP